MPLGRLRSGRNARIRSTTNLIALLDGSRRPAQPMPARGPSARGERNHRLERDRYRGAGPNHVAALRTVSARWPPMAARRATHLADPLLDDVSKRRKPHRRRAAAVASVAGLSSPMPSSISTTSLRRHHRSVASTGSTRQAQRHQLDAERWHHLIVGAAVGMTPAPPAPRAMTDIAAERHARMNGRLFRSLNPKAGVDAGAGHHHDYPDHPAPIGPEGRPPELIAVPSAAARPRRGRPVQDTVRRAEFGVITNDIFTSEDAEALRPVFSDRARRSRDRGAPHSDP